MRRKNNNAIRFEIPFLNNLLQNESSCVELKEQKYHLALHPFHLNNVGESVAGILNRRIAKYDDKLNGILLGYQNVKLLSQAGAVTNDSFFIHLDITAQFFLFKPEVGKILTGTVNKKSTDHVGCLIHNTFNVSLPKLDNVDEDDWMGTKVEIGQDILFRIIFINLEARLPYIRAEFVSILSEQDSGISTSEEVSEKKSKKAKGKPTKIVFNSDSENEQVEIVKSKRKHKKGAEEPESDVEDEGKVKKKKHKHKGHEEEDLELISSNNKKSKRKSNDKFDYHDNNVEEYHEELNSSKGKKHRDHKCQEDDSVEVKANKKKKSKHKYNDSSRLTELEVDTSMRSEECNTKKKKKKNKHKNQEKEECLDFQDTNKKKSKSNRDDSVEIMETEEDLSKQLEFNAASYIKKKNKHKKKELEVEESTTVGSISKKHKKSKHKDSLQEMTDAVLQKTLLNFAEKQKDGKKKKKHSHKDDHDTSLTDLNLTTLFKEDEDNVLASIGTMGNFVMADNEDRKFKNNYNSTFHVIRRGDQQELLSDVDIENLFQKADEGHSRNRKEGHKKAKKRKRSSSGDDFEQPVWKKKA